MANKLSITSLILIIAPLFFGCGGPATAENKSNAPAGSASGVKKYIIDTAESLITWKGSMVLASADEHTGYVHISKGELMIGKEQLVGGTAEINMQSIEYADKTNKNTPVQHLKSPDYFDVGKFPVSSINIMRVTPVHGNNITITATLTIKGVTRPVSFPAYVEVKDGIVKASGKLTIDRTNWGIRYRSGKFFDAFADQIVSDDVAFHMKIVARQ